MSEAGEILDQIELDDNEQFTSSQIAKFKADPAYYKCFVKAVEEQVNGNFPIVCLRNCPFFQTLPLTGCLLDA